MGAAFVAPGEALVDAVCVGLVGDDENATVGGRRRCGEEQRTGHKPRDESHVAPIDERIALIR